MKYIAIDIDDTLNNFTDILKNADFTYYNQEIYDKYIDKVRNDEYEDSNEELEAFRQDIHRQCYELANARPDAVEFMRWLRRRGWTICLLTYRDLRYCIKSTKEWLSVNRMPYDYIFSTDNKAVFCKAWKIPILIDDANTNIMACPPLGIKMYYPIHPHNENFVAENVALDSTFITGAQGFSDFEEVKQWIK